MEGGGGTEWGSFPPWARGGAHSPTMHMGPMQVWASHLETWAGKLGRVSTGVEVMKKMPAQPEGALNTSAEGQDFLLLAFSPES